MLSLAKFGDVADTNITPKLFSESNNFFYVSILTFSISVFCFICSIIYYFIDKLHEDKEKIVEKDEKKGIPNNINESFFKQFTLLIFFLSINCVISYSVEAVFFSNIFYFIHSKFNISISNSGKIVSLSFIIPIIFLPIFGYLINKINKKIYFLILSFIILLLSNCLFTFLPSNTTTFSIELASILFGLFLSIYQITIWVCFNSIMDKKFFGRLKGFLTCIIYGLNLTLSIIYGSIFDVSINLHKQFLYPQLFLISLIILGLIFILIFLYFDRKGKKIIS